MVINVKNEKIFVYGSLRKDEPLHEIIKPYIICDYGIDILYDWALYNETNCFYPYAIRQDNSFIIGELYLVNNKCINELDEIESQYNRIYENGIIIYEWNDERKGFHIEHGDWIKYKKEILKDIDG